MAFLPSTQRKSSNAGQCPLILCRAEKTVFYRMEASRSNSVSSGRSPFKNQPVFTGVELRKDFENAPVFAERAEMEAI